MENRVKIYHRISIGRKLATHQTIQKEYEKATQAHKDSYATAYREVHDALSSVLTPMQIKTSNEIVSVSEEMKRVCELVKQLQSNQERPSQTLVQITEKREAAQAATGSAQVPHDVASRIVTIEQLSANLAYKHGEILTQVNNLQTDTEAAKAEYQKASKEYGQLKMRLQETELLARQAEKNVDLGLGDMDRLCKAVDNWVDPKNPDHLVRKPAIVQLLQRIGEITEGVQS